jgi:hypothetical protein
MNLFTALQIFTLAYSTVVVVVTIILFVFEIRYKSLAMGQFMLFHKLQKVRGNWSVVILLWTITILFLISWIVMAIPWIEIGLTGTHFTFKPYAYGQPWVTYIGTFKGKEGDMYFLTILVNILGVKGYFIVARIAEVLRDTTKVVSPGGTIHYRQNKI